MASVALVNVTLADLGVQTDDVTTAVPLTSSAKWRIGRAWREIRRGASAARVKDVFYGSGDDGLDMALADALSEISQRGSLRMGELAEALHITPASTTRAVACLVDRGYVERVKSSEDQRSIVVSATGSGLVRYAALADRLRYGMDQILGDFTVDEQSQLADLLERYLAAVDSFILEEVDNPSS